MIEPLISVQTVTKSDFSQRGGEFRELSLSMDKWFVTTILVTATLSLSFVISKLLTSTSDDELYPILLISIWFFLFAMVSALFGYLKTAAVVSKRSELYDVMSNKQDCEITKHNILFEAKRELIKSPFFLKLSENEKKAKGNDEQYIISLLDHATRKIFDSLSNTEEKSILDIDNLERKIKFDKKNAIFKLYVSIFFISIGFLVPITFETLRYVCSN